MIGVAIAKYQNIETVQIFERRREVLQGGLVAPADYASVVNHAWVHVHDGTQWWLLETCARPHHAMLVPSAPARTRYLPAAAIDHRLRSHAFANLYHLRAGHALLRLPPA